MPGDSSRDSTRSETAAGSLEETEAASTRDGSVSDPTVSYDQADSPDDSVQSARGPTARWWMGIAVGSVVSLPMGWLLCYAALLPFFLGLFFFSLVGLVIGAIVHRVASPGRPYKRSAVLAGTVLLVVVGWTVSIVKEGRHVPVSMARKVTLKTRDLGDRTTAEFHAYVAGQIREYVRERYPPGGTIGYIRWVLSSGQIAEGEIDGVRRTMREAQRKHWWALRVVLSIGLFAFGVSSQTLLMRLPKDPAAVIAERHD